MHNIWYAKRGSLTFTITIVLIFMMMKFSEYSLSALTWLCYSQQQACELMQKVTRFFLVKTHILSFQANLVEIFIEFGRFDTFMLRHGWSHAGKTDDVHPSNAYFIFTTILCCMTWCHYMQRLQCMLLMPRSKHGVHTEVTRMCLHCYD